MLERLRTDPALANAGFHALLITALFEALAWWPIDLPFIRAMIDHSSVYALHVTAYKGGWLVVTLFGILGLLRRSWPQRIAAIIALYRVQLVIPDLWSLGSFASGGLLGMAYDALVNLLFTGPFSTAVALVHDSAAQATPLIAAYFIGVYVVIRLTFMWSRKPIAAWVSRRLQRWNPTASYRF